MIPMSIFTLGENCDHNQCRSHSPKLPRPPPPWNVGLTWILKDNISIFSLDSILFSNWCNRVATEMLIPNVQQVLHQYIYLISAIVTGSSLLAITMPMWKTSWKPHIMSNLEIFIKIDIDFRFRWNCCAIIDIFFYNKIYLRTLRGDWKNVPITNCSIFS